MREGVVDVDGYLLEDGWMLELRERRRAIWKRLQPWR